MASIEDRFQAAVNVIKGLPKNGPYQPSTAMMLKFYGLYKQATEGPCPQKRPGFWDVVGKAKWDAWNDNRYLTKEQAMQRYVDGLREIIETMSFTENVQNFVGSISGLDNINLEELDMVAPGMRELAESHPNSPFNSRTNSPQHGASANTHNGDADQLPAVSTMNGHAPNKSALNSLSNGNGHAPDDEEFVAGMPPTPMPTPTQELPIIPSSNSAYATSNGTVEQSDDEYGDPVDMQHDFTETMSQQSELLKQIQATVARMNADVLDMSQRMGVLEKTVHDVRAAVGHNKPKAGGGAVASNRAGKYPSWWPFDDISPAWFTLLVLWPFLVGRISRALTPRRK